LATWDVFRSDRLEIERGLSTEAVRAALLRGELHDDDLGRPAGTTTAWARLADLPALVEATPAPPEDAPAGAGEETTLREEEALPGTAATAAPAPAPLRDAGLSRLDLDLPTASARGRIDLSSVELIQGDDLAQGPDPLEEDEEAAAFTLSRNEPEKVEELDLAAMVDIAFQLVLFFLVTSTVVLYKTLEVPKPNSEAPAGATQGKTHGLDDLKNDYILVEIDAGGAMKIDREPVAAEMSALVERLRAARDATGRKSMLLSADAATAHRGAVLAYDAANEIGLGIAIARPTQAADRR
jgi:biopolymer transport protein ExbD